MFLRITDVIEPEGGQAEPEIEKSEALRANPIECRYAGGLASLGTLVALACEPQTSCVQRLRSPRCATAPSKNRVGIWSEIGQDFVGIIINRMFLRITDVIETLSALVQLFVTRTYLLLNPLFENRGVE